MSVSGMSMSGGGAGRGVRRGCWEGCVGRVLGGRVLNMSVSVGGNVVACLGMGGMGRVLCVSVCKCVWGPFSGWGTCCEWMRITCRGSSAIRGCHEEGSWGGTIFWDFLKLPGHTKSIPWPGIRAAAAQRASGTRAWRGAIQKLAPLEFKTPNKSNVRQGLGLAMAGVANVVQPFLLCDPVTGVCC
eukprot:305814-Chlamydomonas_euryale.AAC.2